MLLTVEEAAEVLKKKKVPVLGARTGTLDISSEVQVSNRLSVLICNATESYRIFELRSDDPDAPDFTESNPYAELEDLIPDLKAKLDAC